MKCKVCNTEMYIDSIDESEDMEVFYYKCPNPICTNYGYKKESENAESNK